MNRLLRSKWFHRLLVPILAFALVAFPLAPFSLYLQAKAYADALKPVKEEKVPKKEFPKRPAKGQKAEIPEWRSGKAKHFLKDDGTFEMQVSQNSQHYQDRVTKEWLDIDNTVVSSDKKDYAYKNKANRYEAQFAATGGSDAHFQFNLDDATLEWVPLGMENVPAITKDNTITYSNALGGSDLQYTLQPDAVKESILLNNPSESLKTYSFRLKLTNLSYKVREDGGIVFSFADSGLFAFVLPSPVMLDAKKVPTTLGTVKQTIRRQDDQLYLDIEPDQTWIQDKDRKFPITIDPPILTDPQTDRAFTQDSFSSEIQHAEGLPHVFAGLTPEFGKTQAYITFPLPGIPDGARITDATVQLYNGIAKNKPTTLNLYSISNSWYPGAWNKVPQMAQTPATTYTVAASTGWSTINVTSLAWDWYAGKQPNFGIAFVPASPTDDPVGFVSSSFTSDPTRTPQMSVTYAIDPEGSNHFWTYSPDGVMPYKGNLLYTNTDLSTSGRGVNVTVNRSYNSRSIGLPGVFGPGWLSTLDMRVWDLRGSFGFLDDAGTRHIFDRVTTGGYTPPAGITLSLTNTDTVRVTTTENIIYTFDINTGRLVKVTDSNKNETVFDKDATTGDTLIKDASGRVTRVHYLSNGRVDNIVDPKGRKAQYAYDDVTGMLKSVTLSLGSESTTTSYSYVPSKRPDSQKYLLSSVTDPKGNTVIYAYDDWDRASKVTRTVQDKTSEVSYMYPTDDLTGVWPRKVTMTGMNNQQIVYSTNDNGNVLQTDVKLNDTETASTTYTWGPSNWLEEIKAPKHVLSGQESSHTTSIEYGNNGKPIQVTMPDNSDLHLNYDLNNNLVSLKDQMDSTESATYNENNSAIDITDPVGNTVMQDVDAKGNILSRTYAMSLSDNLLFNSGYENVQSGVATGWGTPTTPAAGDVYAPDTTTKSSGNYSLHVKAATTNGLVVEQANLATVSPNIPYNLGVDLKLGANTTAELRVVFYDKSMNLITTVGGLILTKSYASGLDWQRKYTSVIAPSNAARAKVQIAVNGSGESWFDSIQFEGGVGRSGSNLLYNGNLENDVDKTLLADGWFKPYLNTSGINIDYNEKHSGVASERVYGEPTAFKYVIQRLKKGGYKGTKFNLTGWSKAANLPTSGGAWELQLELAYTDGTTDYLRLPFDRTNPDWQQASRVFEAPKDFYQVGVKLGFDKMPTTAYANFDDVSLTLVNPQSSSISQFNYVGNPSFESDYDNTKWPDGWYRSSGNGKFTSTWENLTTTNGNVYTGEHAVKINSPGSWESVARTDELLPLTTGKTYTAVGYVKTVNVSSSAVLLVHCYDANGAWIGEIPSQTVTGTKDWTRVSVYVNSTNVPANTAKIAIGVQMRAGTGVSYFDNIRLQEGDFRVRYEFDTNQNYVTAQTNQAGERTQQVPEASTGNILSYTDGENNLFTYSYDLEDRLKVSTFPFQGAIGASPVRKQYSYGYDLNGNLNSVTDPNGVSTLTMKYNGLNLPETTTERVTFNGTTFNNPATYSYDTSGRLQSIVLPGSQTTKAGYDYSNRLTSLNFSKDSNTAKPILFKYAYDLNGNMTSFGIDEGSFATDYDNMNRLTKVTEPYPNQANTFVNSYDDSGRRNKLTVQWESSANKWEYTYSYDKKENAMSLHEEPYKRDSRYLYDESGRLIKSYNSNGTSTYYDYDPAGRVKQVRIELNGATIFKQRYDRDKNGNVTKTWDDIDGSYVEYKYDSMQQLLVEQASDGSTKEYQYDVLGNRVLQIVNGNQNTVYQYNPERNRLISAGGRSYLYDPNGNVSTDQKFTYEWGSSNKLETVKTVSGSTVLTYTYDAIGRRETKTASSSGAASVTTRYHYDGERVSYVTEWNGTDTKIYRFVYNQDNEPVFMSYAGKQYWYHFDRLGNVTMLTDVDGVVQAKYRYDAFGNVTGLKNTEIENLNPLRFAGYWYDTDTQKYYMKNRYYDPEVGRFLARDAELVRIGSTIPTNGYVYAANNPVRFIDPQGTMNMTATREASSSTPTPVQGPPPPTVSGVVAGVAGANDARISSRTVTTTKTYDYTLSQTKTKSTKIGRFGKAGGSGIVVGMLFDAGLYSAGRNPEYNFVDSLIDNVAQAAISFGVGLIFAGLVASNPIGWGIAIGFGVSLGYSYLANKNLSLSKVYRRITS